MLPPLKPIVVGIDPGVHTGVGIWSRKTGKVLSWCTRNFVTVQGYLETVLPNKGEVKVFVEFPPKFMYRRNDVEAGHVRDRKQQMMASNRQEAKLLFEMLNAAGWDVELVPPVRETKWDAKRFRLFTGSSESSTEHERDAVRLAVYYANKRKEIGRG